jgi:flavodoxin-like protein
MSTLVVYESVYGNTRAIAEAIADTLTAAGHEVTVTSVANAPDAPGADLLVVGGPTHMHGLTTSLSRHMAVKAATEEDGHVEPDAADEHGLRQWLRSLPDRDGARAAAFDTRGDANVAVTGSAARGIARRLRRRGYEVIASESYLVDDSEGPLTEGELDRARAWASGLAAGRATAATT